MFTLHFQVKGNHWDMISLTSLEAATRLLVAQLHRGLAGYIAHPSLYLVR